jgi:hypothetical protein
MEQLVNFFGWKKVHVRPDILGMAYRLEGSNEAQNPNVDNTNNGWRRTPRCTPGLVSPSLPTPPSQTSRALLTQSIRRLFLL